MNIFFVTSLPRTGTTSLCKMAKTCGLKGLHVLDNISFSNALDQGYNFFADTPFYCPEFLMGLLELKSQKYKYKFIYCHKEKHKHKLSLQKLYEKWTPNPILDSIIHLLDHLCHNQFSDYYIDNHYMYIQKICNFYNIDMLDYSFDQGWETFCNFIDRPIPTINIPHLNKL